LMFAAAQNRAEAIKALLAHKADPKIASKALDVAHELAMDRAAGQLQRKVLDDSVTKGQTATSSQVQAAYDAARQLYRTGKVPPRPANTAPDDPNAPQVSAANNFDPDEINPPVATTGGLTALLHAARQGHLDATRALLDGGAPIDQVGAGDGVSPLLMAVINGQFDVAMLLIERNANANAASNGNGVTPLWAAINTQWQPRTRFPQPQEMEQQNATYLDVAKTLLDAGADPNGRVRSHPWCLVYSGCGHRHCG